MLGLPRTTVLVAALAFGTVLMSLFATGLVRVVRQTRDSTALVAPLVRVRLFFLILGIVVGAWFFTFGLLSLALGV